MINASRKSDVEKPTENVKVPFDEYNELSSISTKVDIIVDLMCHGTLMAEDVLRILKALLQTADFLRRTLLKQPQRNSKSVKV